MSQMLAFTLPAPVAIALAVFLLLLCALFVAALSVRQPAPVRAESEERTPHPRGQALDAAMLRLHCRAWLIFSSAGNSAPGSVMPRACARSRCP